MPIFAFRSWLFKFRIWSYLHHKNVSDKQRKSKEEDFNLHYMFFCIVLFMPCFLPNLICTKYLSYHMLGVRI